MLLLIILDIQNIKEYLKVYQYPVKCQAVILQDVASKQLSSIIISISFNRKGGVESRSDSMLLTYLEFSDIVFFSGEYETKWDRMSICTLYAQLYIFCYQFYSLCIASLPLYL